MLTPLARPDLEPHWLVLRVGTTSLTLDETMQARDGRVVARSRAVAVLRDRSTGATRPLSEPERTAAQAWLA